MKSGVGLCNSPSKVEGYGLVVEGGEEGRLEFYLKVDDGSIQVKEQPDILTQILLQGW